MRCDLLASNMTAGKEQRVRELLAAYRKGAVLLGREQWRLFFETGRFQKNHDVDKTTFAAAIGAANRVQMCRWQVVGQLDSWLSNRANDFRDAVNGSTLDPDTRHMLHVINRAGAWFARKDIVMRDTREIVPDHIRRLARSIMRYVMGRHRRPDLSRISMRLDHRAAALAAPAKADQQGRVGWWVNLSTMTTGRKIAVPLLTYDRHRSRKGKVSNGVLVTEDRDSGRLQFGVVTDIAEECAALRAAYQPEREVMALDFGLSTLFATDEGDQLGRDWLKALRRYDHRITGIVRHVQRSGGRPRDSRRYREAVTALRGFIRTEVGRVLNALVAAKQPATLVLEGLDFQNPALSRHLNRLIQNCGRSVIRAKLADLHDRFGVDAEEVNPAYTSQTCSACGYVDKKNRPSQARFRCLWCGNTMHADCNAARNIGGRRAVSIRSVFQRKDAVLGEVVRAFTERRVRALRSGRTGARGCPADPRDANPYFGGVRPIVARSSGRRKAVQKSVEALPLVA
jgi:putative transposase